jgi:MFS superfamily sulfate permease-like transporter
VTALAQLIYNPILGHLGHWYVSLPVFGAPVLIIAIVVKVLDRRERRRAREGDTSHLRVVVTQGEDRTILTVSDPLDYPTLLDIEHELGEAVRNAPQIVIDLRNVTTVDEDFAWGVTDAITSVEGAEITVLIGSAPALRALKDVSTLEGVTLVDRPSGTVPP